MARQQFHFMAKKLKDAGLNVGLFDGDLYGPNILNLFDVNLEVLNHLMIKIPRAIGVDGIQIASVELILNKQETVLERADDKQGPWGHVSNVSWTDLDYLIIDIPGTESIFNYVQSTDINESLLICKDDLMSIEDSKKTIQLLNRFNIKILGCIENMSENFKLGEKAIN